MTAQILIEDKTESIMKEKDNFIPPSQMLVIDKHNDNDVNPPSQLLVADEENSLTSTTKDNLAPPSQILVIGEIESRKENDNNLTPPLQMLIIDKSNLESDKKENSL